MESVKWKDCEQRVIENTKKLLDQDIHTGVLKIDKTKGKMGGVEAFGEPVSIAASLGYMMAEFSAENNGYPVFEEAFKAMVQIIEKEAKGQKNNSIIFKEPL